MVSFTAADHARVASGELTVTWRLWKYAHVRAGKPYSTGFGWIHVEDVRAVRVADVTDTDAAEAGLRDAKALVELARSHTGAAVSPDTLLHRVQFRYLSEAPEVERPRLTAEEVSRRLDRMDRTSSRVPWTLATLRLIETNPGVPARVLAGDLDCPTPVFKADVRKLKALGLTVSLEVGYELSDAGQEYLDSLEA